MKTKIKICGITSCEQAISIARFEVDYLGFIINFFRSPRNISMEKVVEIVKQVKKINSKIKFVGVFVNQNLDFVKEAIFNCELDVVQLHGNESPFYCNSLGGNAEVWKAVVVKNLKDVNSSYRFKGFANKIVFDSGRGSGKEIHCDFLLGEDVDVLAGGIGLKNVCAIIKKINPKVIDMNSCLESSPGIKNIDLVEQVVNEIKKV